MKKPISWHEECLKNWRATHKEKMARLMAIADECERSRIDIEIYEYQIKRAKQEGRDGFDRDKFGKSRAASSSSQESK